VSEAVRRWIAESPYARALGVELAELEQGSAVLRLPYRDANSNPGRVLHGGVAASLAALAAQAVARAAQGEQAGPWQTAQLQVSYLAAATGEDVVARAALLRQGKELCFARVEIASAQGRPVAEAEAVVRARFGSAEVALPEAAGDPGGSDPGLLGRQLGAIPFLAARGVRSEHMASGRSRLVMPWRDQNADADGGVHEGAVLALLDTAGAMAAWAETDQGRYRASTPALQAQLFASPGRSDLVAWGRCVRRDGPIFWSDVEVARAADRRVCARGGVLYRILD
jgi:uncharacterized protein (TIGR00369 family)